MNQKEPYHSDEPDQGTGGLQLLNFQKVERVATYQAGMQTFKITARHASKYIAYPAIKQLLDNVKVKLTSRAVDSVPTSREDPSQTGSQVEQKEQQPEPRLEEVQPVITFEFTMDKSVEMKPPYAVDFSIDPQIHPIATVNNIDDGSSPQWYQFGNGVAHRIEVTILTIHGNISASVFPGNFTSNPKSIAGNNRSSLGALDSNGTTFSIVVTGDGLFAMSGAYFV